MNIIAKIAPVLTLVLAAAAAGCDKEGEKAAQPAAEKPTAATAPAAARTPVDDLCEKKSKCSAETWTPADIAKCKTNMTHPKCGALNVALRTCVVNTDTCTPEGKLLWPMPECSAAVEAAHTCVNAP